MVDRGIRSNADGLGTHFSLYSLRDSKELVVVSGAAVKEFSREQRNTDARCEIRSHIMRVVYTSEVVASYLAILQFNCLLRNVSFGKI